MKIRIKGGLTVENLTRALFTRPVPTPPPVRQAVPPPIFLRLENQMRSAGTAEMSEVKEMRATRLAPPDPQPSPAPPQTPTLNLQHSSGLLSRALNWIRSRQSVRSRGKRLQVGATVSLGEKRFVAVIQVDGQQFLVGGGATNVTLLAQLNGKETFGDLLTESMGVGGNQFGELTPAHARLQA
jgi:Flagellar biosynthesis protein, FliO